MSTPLRKYATAGTVDVLLEVVGSPDPAMGLLLNVGDVKIGKNGGAFANLATLPVETPAASGFYPALLSATELTAARVRVQFIDQTTPRRFENRIVLVETYGHAAAQHPVFPADVLQVLGLPAELGESAGTGDGDVPIDHNTGGVDALRYTLPGGVGADAVAIRAYLKAEYDAGTRTVRGTTYTGSDGRWIQPLMLDADTYYLVAHIPGLTQSLKVTLVVP